MSLTSIKGLQSEIFVPITPPPVWAPVTKELKDMTIALASAAGVHMKTDKRFNLAGDTTFRMVPDTAGVDEMMVSHGGYDNGDVNKDINCMFPIDRLHELAEAGYIKGSAPMHYTFMGGGGDQSAFTEKTGPEIAEKLKEEGVDGVVMTAG
jgi:D-proline reductase (dithiol) PrdB